VTRSQLIKALAMHNKHLFEKDIAIGVGLVFEHIMEALLSGQRVEVRGFGSFVLRLRAARSVRNPKTGAVSHQKPSYVLHFKPGKALRERVDQSLADLDKRESL
jgi:integration host factor subunit beta